MAASLAAPDDELYSTAALLHPEPDPAGVVAITDDLVSELLPARREYGPMTKGQVGKAILPFTPSRGGGMYSVQADHPNDGLVSQLTMSRREP